VDFPDPEGPETTTVEVGGMQTSNPSNTPSLRPSYAKDTPLRQSPGWAGKGLPAGAGRSGLPAEKTSSRRRAASRVWPRNW